MSASHESVTLGSLSPSSTIPLWFASSSPSGIPSSSVSASLGSVQVVFSICLFQPFVDLIPVLTTIRTFEHSVAWAVCGINHPNILNPSHSGLDNGWVQRTVLYGFKRMPVAWTITSWILIECVPTRSTISRSIDFPPSLFCDQNDIRVSRMDSNGHVIISCYMRLGYHKILTITY